MESSTYLLKDHNGKDYAIFSGDTLFLGDVGRPDLSQKSDDMDLVWVCGRWFWAQRAGRLVSARQPSFTLPLFKQKLMYSLGK